MDAIRTLESDHRAVEKLFTEYESTGDSERKQSLACQIRQELSIHAAIEELELYPVVRKLPGGERHVEESLEEHQKAKETLASLEKIEMSDPEFDRKMSALKRDIEHHVEEEEGQIFPLFRRELSDERRKEIGERLEKARKVAPTHPHPHAPDRPPANVAAGMVAGMIDRIRDSLASEGR